MFIIIIPGDGNYVLKTFEIWNIRRQSFAKIYIMDRSIILFLKKYAIIKVSSLSSIGFSKYTFDFIYGNNFWYNNYVLF